MWPPVVQALSRESQAHSDDGEFESNRFFSIDPQEAWIEIWEEAQVRFDRVAEFVTGAGNAFGDRQVFQQTIDVWHQVQYCVITLKTNHIGRHIGCDEGVAVSIASDPRPEADRTRIGRQFDSEVSK